MNKVNGVVAVTWNAMTFYIVICQVLLAVDSNEPDNWIVNLGALSHLQ